MSANEVRMSEEGPWSAEGGSRAPIYPAPATREWELAHTRCPRAAGNRRPAGHGRLDRAPLRVAVQGQPDGGGMEATERASRGALAERLMPGLREKRVVAVATA